MIDEVLVGRTILVAEDEYFVAQDLCEQLVGLGIKVVGPAPTIDRVMDLIDGAGALDGAVLDVNLGGNMIFPAADRLAERGVPFLFVTGYDRSVIPPRFDATPRCEKPFRVIEVRNAVKALVRGGSA